MEYPIIRTHQIPLYGSYFGIMFCDTKEKVSKYFDDSCENYEVDFAHYFSVGLNKNGNTKTVHLIAFNLNHEFAKVNHGTISHEVFHAASELLDDCGLELNSGSNESYAYLIGWMTNKVYNLIQKHKLEFV